MGVLALYASLDTSSILRIYAYLVAFLDVKKYRVRWCSKFAFKFGQHYNIIPADLLACDSSIQLGIMVVTW